MVLEKDSTKTARSGDADAKFELELIRSFIDQLNAEQRPEWDKESPKAVEIVESLGLLCTKPAFVCANVGDDQVGEAFLADPDAKRLIDCAASHGMEVIPVCAKIEEELSGLSAEEATEFLAELGIPESGLSRVIKTGYRLLNYITFFTAGPMESRAWTVTRGALAPEAAGKIHTDLQRGFIRMETVSYEDLVECGSWAKAQAAGKLRIEGKDYVVADGDVIHVRFSV